MAEDKWMKGCTLMQDMRAIHSVTQSIQKLQKTTEYTSEPPQHKYNKKSVLTSSIRLQKVYVKLLKTVKRSDNPP